jgi:hypothetical protein
MGSTLWRPAKLVANFEDRGCHVVSVTDPYGRILGFLDRLSANETNTEFLVLLKAYFLGSKMYEMYFGDIRNQVF